MESALAIASSNDAVDFVTVTLGLIFTQYTRHILQTICIVCCCGLLVYDPSRTKKEQHWKHNFAGPTMIYVYVDIIFPKLGLDTASFTILLLCIAILGCIGTLVKQRKDVNIGSLAGCTYVVALFYTIYGSYPNFFTACLLALICGCIGTMLLVYKREYIMMNLTMDITKRQMIYIAGGLFLLVCPYEWAPPTSLLLTLCTIDTFVCERDYIRASWKAPGMLLILVIYVIAEFGSTVDYEYIAIAIVWGCVYISHLADKDSLVYMHTLEQMALVIYKLSYHESIPFIFVPLLVCCFIIDVYLHYKFSKIHILVSGINAALSILFLELKGVSVIATAFVVLTVWILGVMGPERLSIITELWKVWDEYKCDHGTLKEIPASGASCSFMGDIHEFLRERKTNITLECEIFLQLVERLSDNGALAKMGVDERKVISLCLLRLGTNSLLGCDVIRGKRGFNVILYAMFILMFENVPPNGEMTAKEVMTIARGVAELDVRGITKFYSKRIGCSCLEKKYKSYHKALKQVRCHKCRLVKRPKELFWCTGCMTRQYCCKGCQRKDWERGHKVSCKDIARSMTRCLIVGSNECSD